MIDIPVEYPVLDVRPSVLSLVLSLVPVGLDLRDQAIGVGVGGLLSLDTLLLEEGGEASRVPLAVRRSNLRLPVVLDQSLKILAVGWCWVWDVVVGKPSLKLGFMPVVVDYLVTVRYCLFSVHVKDNDVARQHSERGVLVVLA